MALGNSINHEHITEVFPPKWEHFEIRSVALSHFRHGDGMTTAGAFCHPVVMKVKAVAQEASGRYEYPRCDMTEGEFAELSARKQQPLET
jgi:hypothetical protein